jgi:RNA polymerase sigma-70 factor (ECF subfamily)
VTHDDDLNRADPDVALERCFRDEWPALVAAATRIVSDLASAEEIVQDVLLSALARWPFTGIPDRPGGWLLTATRNRARNLVRDRVRERAREEATAVVAVIDDVTAPADDIVDDRLRLIFVCCHPTLAAEAQVALTLRLVCGLSVRQIARAFLQPEATIGQRITRAKRTLAESQVPFEAPPPAEWEARLPAVLGVVYLVFNEGYAPGEGPAAVRDELCDEALRLGALLAELLPAVAEVHGLVALMELHASRRPTRVDDDGNLVLLADQDRSKWDRDHLQAGVIALGRARERGQLGPMTLQAELAACHTLSPTWNDTDWRRIVTLYDELLSQVPSPVVALNRTVAIAMRDGPEAGLEELAPLIEEGALLDYHLLWATRADLARRCGRFGDAATDYRRALSLATNPADVRFLTGRLAECTTEETTKRKESRHGQIRARLQGGRHGRHPR